MQQGRYLSVCESDELQNLTMSSVQSHPLSKEDSSFTTTALSLIPAPGRRHRGARSPSSVREMCAAPRPPFDISADCSGNRIPSLNPKPQLSWRTPEGVWHPRVKHILQSRGVIPLLPQPWFIGFFLPMFFTFLFLYYVRSSLPWSHCWSLACNSSVRID